MSQPIIDEAYAFLRAHTTADLRFEEHMRPIKYVIAPDGKLAAPVMVAMLQSVDTVLFVPEYADGAMEVQVTLIQFEERGATAAIADRWRIYHGEPPDVRWASMTIDAARFGEIVIDGDALLRPNPLAAEESRICREINTGESEGFRAVCARYGKMEVERPVLVGVDPLGFDVRARFEVLRVPTREPMATAADVRRVWMSMLTQAKHGG